MLKSGKRTLIALFLLLSTGSRLFSQESKVPDTAPPKTQEEIPKEDQKPPEQDYVLTLDGEKTPLSESAMAVSVITGEEIRAMGVYSLPEAFRYIPGVSVFQLNGFTYAVGIRGVDDEFNPRIHVYLDGRLVNVAEFGGVDWESIPVSVDDIERIEVIRAVGVAGEAGSSPGGVIRIWSKKPAESSHFTYSGYVGNPENIIHFGRLAGSLGPFSGKVAVEYRGDDGIAGKTSSGGIPQILAPRRLNDDQSLFKFNTNGLWEITDTASFDLRFTGVTGRIEESSGDPVANGRTDTSNYAASILYRQSFSDRMILSLGYYHENFSLKVLDYPLAPLHDDGDDIDLDRHTNSFHGNARISLASFWDVTVGGGWKEDRLMFERNKPTRDNQEILHVNLGTEFRVLDKLFLSGGLQIERDLFSGRDFSPNVGVVYRFLPDHSLRFSYRVGRRRPNFTETRIGFVLPFPPSPPTERLITGNRDLDRETITAFEGGYHGELKDLGLSVDLQIYFHDLDDKVEFVPDPTSLLSPFAPTFTFENSGGERAFGTELFAEWKILEYLSAYGSYTYQDVEDMKNDRRLKNRPKHTANVGSRFDFNDGLLDGFSALFALNYVSEVKQVDAPPVPVEHTVSDRFRLDFRVARRFFDDHVEAAFIGRNILDNETLEFRPALGSNSNGDFGAERSFLFNLLIRL